MEEFIKGFVDAALWLCRDAQFESKDMRGNNDKLDGATIHEIATDCAGFWKHYHGLIEHDPERAGADFYLTRNRHGSGFWDGAWDDSGARILTDGAHSFGTFELYLGDDGKIYHHN